MSITADQASREQALDITKSFIVQAPAGSGKTALLTQRILALLCYANEPEECLAITFTRKAAAEMRERILLALHAADAEKPVTTDYAKKTRSLAIQVLKRDKLCNWNLLANPNRLKIQTIDSLNVSLTTRMPILSGFGAQPEILTAAQELYTLAVHALLTESMVADEYLPFLHVILQHLDNDRELVKKLFVSLLPLREQWLPYIMHTHNKEQAKEILELGLKTAVLDFLQQLTESIPSVMEDEKYIPPTIQDANCIFRPPRLGEGRASLLVRVPIVAAQAAKYLQATDPNSAIINCSQLTTWPGQSLPDLPAWRGIAELLITKTGSLRKTITQGQGFPAPSTVQDKLQKAEFKLHKQNMLEILTSLQEYPIFVENLRLLNYLPPLTYSNDSWQFMEALVKILPLLVAQLTLIFREQGQIDLPQVSMAARMALGGLDTPSDLALALDYKISHILVDEFQDTSIAQFGLLEHLIAGWMEGDGKTLFLVGDPMQSIYRFRQAEVGLFVQAQKFGIAQVKLQPLYLSANFRSTPAIMEWVNTAFAEIFPRQNNPILGEVGYSPSLATRTDQVGCVQFSCFNNADATFEANHIVKLIQGRKVQYPGETIAVLVRSRSHLPRLIAAFKSANISYQGVEIEALADKQIILDLLALSKALLHLSDRIAWLAILRAPWCGLTLHDFAVLFANNHAACVWDILKNFASCTSLSADGRKRLDQIVPILSQAIALRDRKSLLELVKDTWLALAGNLCIQDEQSLADAEVFFELLRTHANNSNIFAIGFWENQLKRLFSKPKVIAADVVQIMTIHKAKGLEFDTVILPGLSRRPRSHEDRLFRWQERTSLSGNKHLIFAPIKAVGQEYDPIYKFLKYTEQERDHYELARLMYVAATRAKTALFGFATLDAEKPASGSMLAVIANYVQQEEGDRLSSAAQTQDGQIQQTYSRLPVATMALTRVEKSTLLANTATIPVLPVTEDLMGSTLPSIMRAVGVVVHKVLWRLATFGVPGWQRQDPAVLNRQLELMLQVEGVSRSQLRIGLDIIHSAIDKTLADPSGLWILAADHTSAAAEFGLTALINGKAQPVVLDRTFVDRQTNVRWIIDYKVVQLINNVPPPILPAYKQQLQLYKHIMQMLDANENINTAIYFPLQASLQVVD